MIEDFDDLVSEALQDRDVRTAAAENSLRRQIGAALDEVRRTKRWSLRAFAEAIGTSASQAQRLLHRTQGGGLTLQTICRAADALGLRVNVAIGPRPDGMESAKVLAFPKIAKVVWHHLPKLPVESHVSKGKPELVSARVAREHADWQCPDEGLIEAPPESIAR